MKCLRDWVTPRCASRVACVSFASLSRRPQTIPRGARRAQAPTVIRQNDQRDSKTFTTTVLQGAFRSCVTCLTHLQQEPRRQLPALPLQLVLCFRQQCLQLVLLLLERLLLLQQC